VEPLGSLRILRRYPFKSMAGEDLEEVFVTYAGLTGDRAYAFVDKNNRSNFPWMTARQAHEMVLFRPRFLAPPAPVEEHPLREQFRSEVTTPEGQVLAVDDPVFTSFFEQRFGRALELRFSERAIEDACPVSLIGLDTMSALSQETGVTLDHRRFRANFYADWENRKPFFEDELVGRNLRIGDQLTLRIVKKDARCVIITLDPLNGESSPNVLEAVARNHKNCLGVYGSVLREGIVRAGDPICEA
jgi:uncharacterized protein YcbX